MHSPERTSQIWVNDTAYHGRLVERAGEQLIAVGVEVQANYFSLVALQLGHLLSGFHVPESRGFVHGAGGDEEGVGVEGDADDLVLVADEGLEALAIVDVPDLGGLVEAAGDDFVARVGRRGTRRGC